MKNSIILSAGDARVELLPELGGTVGAFSWKGKDVFRPTPDGADEVLQSANFPLVPYCNRIPGGEFAFGDHRVTIAPNLLPQPHPLHGQGWRAAWDVEEVTADRAVLSYTHAPGEWPWSYRAVHTIILTGDALRQELSVTNTSPDAMPTGLGFHPYFHAPKGTTMKAHVEGAWMIDEEILPTVHVPGPYGADWTAGASVSLPQLIDHCYTGWDQKAVLKQSGLTVTMTAPEEARWLHLYIPPKENFLCVEPVTNRPNPFGGDGDSGMVTLNPGETFSTWMQVEVSDA